MRPAHLILKGLIICPFIVLSIDSISQELSYTSSSVSSTDRRGQGSGEYLHTALIVNTHGTNQSYPSMEQEMDMYLALKRNDPQVYFFPNPSKGTIWMEHNLGKVLEVRVQDMDDNTVFIASNHLAEKLDLSVLLPGDYTLTVRSSIHLEKRLLTVK